MSAIGLHRAVPVTAFGSSSPLQSAAPQMDRLLDALHDNAVHWSRDAPDFSRPDWFAEIVESAASPRN